MSSKARVPVSVAIPVAISTESLELQCRIASRLIAINAEEKQNRIRAGLLDVRLHSFICPSKRFHACELLSFDLIFFVF